MITGKGQGCPGMGSTASPPAAALFQPAPDFDATEWMETINALGAKYAVYVAKHGCGFCTWRTNATFMNGTRYPYATGGPNGATSVDVVQAFLKAARAANVLPGFYYSLTSNNFLHHEGVNHTEFESIVMQQIRELWDHENSGDLFEIWMDGGYNPDLKANLSALLLSTDSQTDNTLEIKVLLLFCFSFSLSFCFGHFDSASGIWYLASFSFFLSFLFSLAFSCPNLRTLEFLSTASHIISSHIVALHCSLVTPVPTGRGYAGSAQRCQARWSTACRALGI